MDELIHKIFLFLNELNNSRYFAGITMILLNLGSKYISMDLSQTHEKILGSKIIRRLLIFVVVFTATRDIWTSIIITSAFIILVSGLFHDDSNYCLIPKNLQTENTSQKKITKEEIEYAQKIIEQAKKQQISEKHNYELFAHNRKRKLNNYKHNIKNLYTKTTGLIHSQKKQYRDRHRDNLKLIKQYL